MTVTATPVFPQTIKTYVVSIAPADTTSLKTLVTAGTNGTKVECINLTTTDTTGRDIQIWVTVSATNYLLATINVPLSSGNTNALPSIDVLRHANLPSLAYDANGNKFLYLASGATLSIASTTTVTAAKVVTAFGYGEDF